MSIDNSPEARAARHEAARDRVKGIVKDSEITLLEVWLEAGEISREEAGRRALMVLGNGGLTESQIDRLTKLAEGAPGAKVD